MQQPLSKLKMLIILKYVQSEQPVSGKSVQWEKATAWPGSSNKSIGANAHTILNETTTKANGRLFTHSYQRFQPSQAESGIERCNDNINISAAE
jgi:hypothetical protein